MSAVALYAPNVAWLLGHSRSRRLAGSGVVVVYLTTTPTSRPDYWHALEEDTTSYRDPRTGNEVPAF